MEPMVPKWSQIGPKREPNGAKMQRKWTQNGNETIPKATNLIHNASLTVPGLGPAGLPKGLEFLECLECLEVLELLEFVYCFKQF